MPKAAKLLDLKSTIESEQGGFAQKVVFRLCKAAEEKFLQQLGDFLGKVNKSIRCASKAAQTL